MDAGIQQRFFDRDQEMVSQHAKKDVRLYTRFLVVKDRPLG